MQASAPASAKRVSSALGLCVVMLSTLPRYLAGGHETRLTLILLAFVVVLVAAVLQWRLLPGDGRQQLSGMLKRLAIMMMLGALVMGAWHALFTDWMSWQVFISHASTFGLVAHVVSLWWANESHGGKP